MRYAKYFKRTLWMNKKIVSNCALNKVELYMINQFNSFKSFLKLIL